MEQEFTRKIFKKGDVIIREGDVEMVMYDIVLGSVGIYDDYDTADRKLIAVLRDGDCFGEMELISIRARSASVVALEKTEVMVIDKDMFTEYIKSRPEKVIRIMQQLSDKLRKTTAEYVDVCHVAREAIADAKRGEKKSAWYTRLKEHAERFK